MILIRHAHVYGPEHSDADLVLSDSDTMEIDTVVAKGTVMISGKKVLKRGTFEYEGRT